MFCIDASVIISAARTSEPGSEKSNMFLNRLQTDGAKVFLPEIVISEVAAGLFRASKRADFSYAFAHDLRAIPNFSFVAVDARLADLAAAIAVRTGLRSADAIYAALAYDYNLTLVTLDKDQLTRTKDIVAARQP